MILLPECLNALKYSVFWQNNDNPSLKKFLDFRFNSGNLENQTIEHSRYRSELDTISTYYTETSEVGRIVRKCKKDFADDKNSRTIKLFWNKQDIAMESEIIDEEAQLQWKKGTLEFERTGLNYLQATSSAVQEKQISSYTSYKQSTSKFATSTTQLRLQG
ncbi:hypothetical protein C1646_470903 [Rhizophagus diaphanus]|nr:hypothetical protein C1646_470903 [Rhizophagus diaphanus] [Rhizophagus sp. MUCL 43196]